MISIETPKVLLVDDVQANLYTLKHTLKGINAEIFEAGSGNEALSLMLSHEFSVVLLDVQMPGMDGYEVADFMQEEERTRNTPIIFVTAINTEDRHVRKGYDNGAVDYMFKPLDSNIIRAKVNVFLKLFEQKQRLRYTMELEQEKNELLRSNKDLEKFAHIASHDLKAPTTTILGFIDLLRRDKQSVLSQNGKVYLEKMQSSSHRMHDLISKVLEFAKVESNSIPFRDIDLQKVLNEIEVDLNTLIKEANVEIQSAKLPVIEGNEVMIRQLFQNLVSNAIKYRDDLRDPVIEIIEEKNKRPGDVTIAIKDNGRGFREEDAEKVFEPFKRLVGSDDVPGTGIGLATVKKIINFHGGEIHATSIPGEGAQFYFTIPRHQVQNNLRAEPRFPIVKSKQLVFKTLHGSNQDIKVELIDESDNGLGCCWKGPHSFRIGSTLQTNNHYYEICWILEIEPELFHFGMRKVPAP